MADLLPITLAEMIAECDATVAAIKLAMSDSLSLDAVEFGAINKRRIAVMEEIVRYLQREAEPE